jgi:hypothetical protein
MQSASQQNPAGAGRGSKLVSQRGFRPCNGRTKDDSSITSSENIKQSGTGNAPVPLCFMAACSVDSSRFLKNFLAKTIKTFSLLNGPYGKCLMKLFIDP